VFALGYSPDGRTLAVAANEIFIFDTASGRERFRLDAWSGPAVCLAFSPDSRLLACGHEGRTFSVWDPITGRGLREILHGYPVKPLGYPNPRSGVSSLAFSPDGSRLAVAGSDGSGSLWEVATWKKCTTLEPPASWMDGIASLTFSPDGRLVAGANAGEICRWEVSSGKRVRVHDQPDMGPAHIALSPDGATVVMACGQRGLQLWNRQTGQLIRTLDRLDRPEGCSWAACSPDGTLLASGRATDKAVRLWQVATGQVLRSFPKAEVAVFSPDGKSVATASPLADPINLWEITTGKQLWSCSDPFAKPGSLVFSPDGKLLAWAGGRDDVNPFASKETSREPFGVALADAATGRMLRRLHCPQPCRGVAFAPDGRTLAAATAEEIQLWEVGSWRRLRRAAGVPPIPPRPPMQDQVRPLAFSPDSRLLATEAGDHAIWIWEVRTDRVVRKHAGHQAKVTSLAFTPDGRFLVSGSEDTTALVWEVAPVRRPAVGTAHAGSDR
jgi:WD40 repeat protein